VAEDQELPGVARLLRLPRDPQMIAAMLLRDSLDARAMFAPLFSNDGATAVGRRFFQAGLLGNHERTQHREDLRQTRLQ